MVELLKIYKFVFRKREPIFVAALSYKEAIERLYSSDIVVDEESDDLDFIALFNNIKVLV